MSHLFFLDESGTDQKQMPYEIHGGIIVPLNAAWDLICAVKDVQTRLFGAPFHHFGLEIKGERLLQPRIFKFAEGRNRKNPDLPPPTFESEHERRTHALAFLSKGQKSAGSAVRPAPTAREFRAYGLACLELVDEIFRLCTRHHVVVMAAVVEPRAPRPAQREWAEMLRKDLVYLFERLYYFMESQPRGATAVCVFDQKDDMDAERCVEGQRLNECIAKYFTRTHTGRVRSLRILPEPLYTRSDLTSLLGIADLAIYVINHVFRPANDWTQPIRPDLKPYIDWIYQLQWSGQRENESKLFSIFHLSDLRPRGA